MFCIITSLGVFRLDDVMEIQAAPSHEPWLEEIFLWVRKWQNNDPIEVKTSGSTGKPKAILLPKEKIIFSVENTRIFFGLTEDDVLFNCLPISGIGGLMILYRAIILNAPLVAEKPSSQPLHILSTDKIISFAAFTPMQFLAVLKNIAATEAVKKMKAVILGGSGINKQLHQEIQKLKVPVYLTYGMTETCSHVALKKLNGDAPENYFTALPQNIFSTDNRGCLCITNPFEKTVTNDRINLISETEFEYLGRWDNVINSGGIKISPEEVEEKISRLMPEDVSYYCTSQPDAVLGEALVLVIAGEEWDRDNIISLQNKMKETLPPHTPPRKIIFIPEFSYTESGKIIRNKSL